MVDWALKRPNVRVILAGCDSTNHPSIRVLERTGFRRIGEVAGHIRWQHNRGSSNAE